MKGWDVRQAAFDEIRDERKRVVRGLITILESKESAGPLSPVRLAIELLGELRAAEAVKPLCEWLTYAPGGDPKLTTTMAVTIRNCADEEKRKVAAWVLMKIEGKDQAVARLQKSLERRAGGQPQEKRWKEAIEYIRTYKPSFKFWPRQEERK